MDTGSKILLGLIGGGSIAAGILLLSDEGRNTLADTGGLPAPAPDQHPDAQIVAVGYVGGQPTQIALMSIGGRHYLVPDAADAWNSMAADAAGAGITFSINSSFRTMAQQQSLVSKLGRYNEGGLAAKAGKSPHQRGIAVDVNVGSSGKGTPGTNRAWRWLAEERNAARYGFVIDYLVNPGGEAWHLSHEPRLASRFAGFGELVAFAPRPRYRIGL